MALSESDKKKLPILLGLMAVVGGFGGYKYFASSKPAPMPISVAVAQQPMATTSIEQISQQPRPVSLAQRAPQQPDLSQFVEFTDKDGNPVQAVVEPAPSAINSSRTLKLSTEDKSIITYLRSNLLLELEAKNNQLRAKKQAALMPQDGNAGGMQSANTGVAPQNITPTNANNLAGFSDLETTKPTFLGNSMTDSEIEDAFRNVEVASISVGADAADSISGYVRIDGKLFKASANRRIGDYEIEELAPNHVNIRYIPGNVTRKIGHSGFSIN